MTGVQTCALPISVVHRNLRVLGYYGLSPTTVLPEVLPRNVRTGQPPNPIPCLLLGQLAVDQGFIGQGIGSGLIKHALMGCLRAAVIIGGRALIVKAVDLEAAAFWQKCGFIETRGDPLMLFRSMSDILASVEQSQ